MADSRIVDSLLLRDSEEELLAGLALRQYLLQLCQTGGRSDFIKALGHLVAGKLTASDEVPHDLGQVVGVAGRPYCKYRGAKKAQPVINVPHFRQTPLLVVNHDASVAKDHVAGVVE